MTEQTGFVRILLAAYNGERYLREQLESILAQDYSDWQLIVSDDGSKDGTPEILRAYAARYPEKILFYTSGQRFGCAQRHFLHLLRRFADADYLMFADQDDFWHPDKISATLALMRRTEKPGMPALVHTDLRVVDAQRQEMNPSFQAFSGIDGTRLQLNQLLIQNVVTGCTMMINRKLAELAAQPLPADCRMLMHDWWLALIASACGSTAFLNRPTMDYRQHAGNVVGAKNIRSLRYIAQKLHGGELRQALRNCVDQAQDFLRCYEAILPEQPKQTLRAFCKLATAGKIGRWKIYLGGGFLKSGIARRLGQLLWG